MSIDTIDTLKEIHNEFLANYFPIPKADRVSPFIPQGITGTRSFSEGFPDEALIDRLFTRKEDVDAARFSLVDAYISFGVEIGWLNISKNPLIGQELCEKLYGKPYKQGFCADRDFLSAFYDQKRNGAEKWRPEHLGIHTNLNGAPFVIDLDYTEGEKDACQTFFAFLEKNGIDPRSLPCVKTPGGGLHLYFQPYDGKHSNWVDFAPSIWGNGVDIRGKGGVALAPGSFAWTGDARFRQYAVLNNCPPPPLPECVIEVFEDYISKKEKHTVSAQSGVSYAFDGDSELDAACRIVAGRKVGARNSTLNAQAYAMGKLAKDEGWDGKMENEAREKLLQAALRCGLLEGEASRTIARSMVEDKMAGSYKPYGQNGQPAVTVSAEPSVRKIPSIDKSGDDPDEDFIAGNGQADFIYTSGFLTRFAERKGRIDEKRLDGIAKKIFPPKIYE